MEAAERLFRFFRASEANNPQAFIAAVAEIFTHYPVSVVNSVCSPMGLPIQSKWLPSIAEIYEACEQIKGHAPKPPPPPLGKHAERPKYWVGRPGDPNRQYTTPISADEREWLADAPRTLVEDDNGSHWIIKGRDVDFAWQRWIACKKSDAPAAPEPKPGTEDHIKWMSLAEGQDAFSSRGPPQTSPELARQFTTGNENRG